MSPYSRSWMVAALLGIFALGACAEEDKEAPPAPRVRVERTQTTLEKISIAGSAEYAAKVTVTREPALPSDFAIDLSADPFTAEFFAELPLELGDNSFSFTAVDAAGNASEPSALKISRVALSPQRLSLSLSAGRIGADQGSVDALAVLGHDEAVSLLGQQVAFSAQFEDAAVAPVEVTAEADAQGRARATLAGLDRAGSWTIRAHSVPDETIADEAGLEVVAGPAVSVTVELFADGVLTEPLPDPVSVDAGDELSVRATALDRFGNVSDAPIALSTSIPGAAVVGERIVDIARAGDFRVVASVIGTSVAGFREVEVLPGAPAELELRLSASQMKAGDRVSVEGTVYDAFGNVIPEAQVQFSSIPALAATYTPPGSAQALNQGFVGNNTFIAYDLSQVAAGGYAFEIRAQVMDAAGTSVAFAQSAGLEVRPAAASGFSLIPDPADPAQLVPSFVLTSGCATGSSCNTASLQAGQDLSFSYGVVDRWGNATTGPVSVYTDAPGAMVVSDGVSGIGLVSNLTFARASAYHLNAYIAGVPGGLTRTFYVGTAAPAEISLSLSSTLVSLGGTVKALATVRDGFGNLVGCPSENPVPASVMVIGSDPAAGSTDLQCLGGTFYKVFTFGSEATYTIEATYLAGPVSATGYVAVLGFDNTPPTISVQNVVVEGQPCSPGGSPMHCTVRPGDQIDFDAVAADNISLSEVSYSAFFSSTQTVRARTVLVGSNVSDKSIHFTFSVPGGALPEQVSLAAQAVDGAGNRANSAEVLLDVNLGAIGLAGRTIEVLAAGGLISQPESIVARANDVIVGNSDNVNGTFDLVRVDGANTSLFAASAAGAARYLASDSQGQVYASAGNAIRQYAIDGTLLSTYNTGVPTSGIAVLPPTPQRGQVNVGLAVDGNTLTVDSGTPNAWTFELDSNASCTSAASKTCVSFTQGTPSANAAANLASAINAAGLRVSATAGSNGLVTMESKIAGEPNATTNPRVAVARTGTGITIPASGTLSDGHDSELWFGNRADNLVRRAALGGTTTHGTFDMNDLQWGVAARDIWTAPTANSFDYLLYVIPDGQQNELWARRSSGTGSVAANTSSSFFRLQQSGAGQNFNNLWAVALSPNGSCLLVTDEGAGAVYAVDVSNPLNAAPRVERVASGMWSPRGIAFDAQGRALIADRDANVVYRLSPLAVPTGCF